MFTKGKIRAQGGRLARYLMTGDPGETAQVVEMRGLERFGKDPVTAFHRMEQWAEEKTHCSKAFFHGHIRLPDGERMTDAQWMEAADRMEKTLGFTGQPRMISFHIDQATGEKHLHAAWFRIDLETERAKDPGLYKNKFKHLSRELEKKFGLEVVSNERKPGDRAKAADRNEHEESRRLGTNLKEIRNAILNSFEKSDSGRAFHAAMKAHGFELATGDRRDCFVVIDPAGGQHALNKKLTGMTLAKIRERLGDIDQSTLPSVDQAKAIQAERLVEASQSREGPPQTIAPPNGKTPSHGPEIGPSIDFIQRQPESEDMDEETANRMRAQTQEGLEAQIMANRGLEAEHEKYLRFMRDQNYMREEGLRDRRQLEEDQARTTRQGELDITDAQGRAKIAAGYTTDFVQMVRMEAGIKQQQEDQLNRDIGREQDPEKRQMLEFKRDIQHADYMALTWERVGAMSNLNSEQYKEALKQQEFWQAEATDLRGQRLELRERMADAVQERSADAASIDAADKTRSEFRENIKGETQDATQEMTDRKQSTKTAEQAEHLAAIQQDRAAADMARGAERTGGRSL